MIRVSEALILTFDTSFLFLLIFLYLLPMIFPYTKIMTIHNPARVLLPPSVFKVDQNIDEKQLKRTGIFLKQQLKNQVKSGCYNKGCCLKDLFA